MRRIVQGKGLAAIKTAGHSVSGTIVSRQLVSRTIVTVQSVTNDETWFRDVVRAVLPKDAGLALSLYTGANERSCYRYAEGSRDPTVPFLRRLIQSEYGLPFHAAFMDGCRAEWWVSLQRKLRNGGRVEEAKFE